MNDSMFQTIYLRGNNVKYPRKSFYLCMKLDRSFMKSISIHHMSHMPYDDPSIYSLLNQSDILSSKKFSFSGIFFDIESSFQNIKTA